MSTWTKPSYTEVRMNAEIGAYQGDPDFAPACAVVPSESEREPLDGIAAPEAARAIELVA